MKCYRVDEKLQQIPLIIIPCKRKPNKIGWAGERRVSNVSLLVPAAEREKYIKRNGKRPHRAAFAHFPRDFKHFLLILSEPFLLSRGTSEEIKVTVIRHSSGI